MSRPTFHYADDGARTLVFHSPLEWGATQAAETWLKARGFAVGTMQRAEPRGILHSPGEAVLIMKWRNLRPIEREALHGIVTGDWRRGPVEVRIFASAPPAAQEAIVAAQPSDAARVQAVGIAFDVGAALALVLAFGCLGYVCLRPLTTVRHDAKIEMRIGQAFATEVRR